MYPAFTYGFTLQLYITTFMLKGLKSLRIRTHLCLLACTLSDQHAS